VSRERATSANARHECFVMDASVSVSTAATAEMDEEQQRTRIHTSVSHCGGRVRSGSEPSDGDPDKAVVPK
jgi:hypothetical protein